MHEPHAAAAAAAAAAAGAASLASVEYVVDGLATFAAFSLAYAAAVPDRFSPAASDSSCSSKTCCSPAVV